MKNPGSQDFDLGKVTQTNLRQAQAKLLRLVLQDKTVLGWLVPA